MKRMRYLRKGITILFFFAAVAVIVSACGGNGGGTSDFSIGGSVTGLSGTLVLQNNGGDDLTIITDGPFVFSASLADGSNYDVTVLTQPASQTCTVTNGSGTLSGANITNVSVNCVSTAGCNTVNITDDVTTNTTWTSGNVYVIRTYDFYVTATLQIEAGTIIKFHPADGPYAMLSGSGTIVANGTAADPIVFTSFKDDNYCGDTNGDGSATSPGPGDWELVGTNGTQGSVFNYCEFYYGGGGTGYDSTLDLFDSRATVTNSTFAHNNGLDEGTLDASDARAGTIIAGNVFYDNVRPLYIDTTFNMDDSNTFHNPANPAETNTYNGIFLSYPNHFISHISWEETEVPFVIDDNDLWVNSGATLTLGNNVVLKFMPGSTLLLDDGASALVNNNGAGVFFTSYKDDSLKGDTNGDGSATSPGNGDWEGIYDNSLTIPSPYFFTWTNILYDSY